MPINMNELNCLVDDKIVTRIPDPEGSPLCLYNYTWKVQMDGLWTPVTRLCRGLVLDTQGNIIARPFEKFFNLGEKEETRIENLPAEIPEITDKRDGSLIIVFFDPYNKTWRCCTRGSWISDQAIWANTWLNNNHFNGNPHYTYLFELTAPWNRIVVLYPEEKMTLLAANYYNGREMSRLDLEQFASQIGCDIVNYYQKPISEINLAIPVFNNEEGYVVKYSNGLRVKMKYDAYCRLHKTMTGLSIRGIWESLMAGDELDLSELPDEFLNWYKKEKGLLLEQFRLLSQQVDFFFKATDISQTRKDIAIGWKDLPGPIKASLFMRLDNRDPSYPLWKSLKPEVHKTFQKDE